MWRLSEILLICCAVLAAAESFAAAAGSPELTLARISAVNKRTQAQASFVAELPLTSNIGAKAIAESLRVSEQSKVTVSVGMERDGKAFFPHQAFLVVRRERDGVELLFVAERKGSILSVAVPAGDNTADSGSSSSDPFWLDSERYAFTLIIGDWDMKNAAIVWKLCDRVELFYEGSVLPRPPAPPGVFDFDLSTKRALLPEYRWEQPQPARRAPLAFVLAFTILSAAPTVLFFALGARFGAFPLVLPSSGSERKFVFAFGACLGLYALGLIMFWIKWTIFDTFKFMVILLPPTILTGHRMLANVAKRAHASTAKSN